LFFLERISAKGKYNKQQRVTRALTAVQTVLDTFNVIAIYSSQQFLKGRFYIIPVMQMKKVRHKAAPRKVGTSRGKILYLHTFKYLFLIFIQNCDSK
jgi:hypothetical protein